MLEIIVALAVTSVVAYFVLKGYKAQAILIFGGIILMLASILLGKGLPLPEGKSTGSTFLDIFHFIKITFSSQSAGLGLKIMEIAGFAFYMHEIGASASLVRVLTKPLERVRHMPYLFMALCFFVGEFLSIFITSASGLGVLLMVTLYPLMRGVGLSPLTACAPIATAVAVEMGPAQGNVNFAAELIGIDVVEYVVNYQILVAVAALAVIAFLHIVVQKYFDKAENYQHSDNIEDVQVDEKKQQDLEKAPTSYAILPIIPLVLIFMFNKLTISSIKMDVTTAMLVSIVIALLFEYFTLGNAKKVVNSVQIFFDGMGKQFANVVTFIVAGQTFAQGLKTIGVIDIIIESAKTAGFGPVAMTIVMVSIIMVTSVLMGSGNAAFFSFANLVPGIAAKMGIAPVMMLLPMQFVAGLSRNISPIAPNMVAIAGVANVSPFALAKRTAIPMLGGIIISTLVSIMTF
ncbi:MULTISPECIES: C4-dicarboxylate transporter DcuC [Pasteurellaceae]|uniref:C4-dicarboxylate transporter DcuC n=1 Tax=Pasteurella atlantica TaxID=2827233 RepID=A0AAW8CMM1_9PAST|nr:C4-dicarboxylate transporter DcuC [Pasteurella atlantica]MBR0574366.1 C4-dicarboxylate transporter DcuC [Pasteurella atlantica]MDP8040251.1 C4-dicarboxylate transporter DcuC [Pasteurella atlantica]MDP8042383.1 C4-dicarboxylate transporter DcuC [Pasteurella atlantica]MDP8046588.1 C4-dicarboxylate transporter DcuC [Pasteurella atlantica]MDP8062463.1 C4-dicarboxylate transporter DcuC [Pasteurella atlantica]